MMLCQLISAKWHHVVLWIMVGMDLVMDAIKSLLKPIIFYCQIDS